jgi:hypothetical protein
MAQLVSDGYAALVYSDLRWRQERSGLVGPVATHADVPAVRVSIATPGSGFTAVVHVRR